MDVDQNIENKWSNKYRHEEYKMDQSAERNFPKISFF